MTVLMGLLALVIDAGSLKRHRRMAQGAADAAALAGAVELFRGRSESEAFAAAQRAAWRNGYTNGADGVTVTVGHPSSGTFASAAYVQVAISEDIPTLFGGVVGRTSFTVHTRSVGGTGAANGCLAILDPTAYHALDISSGGVVTAGGCSVTVNSSDAEALYVKNNSTLSAGSIGVVGGVGGTGTITSDVVTGVPPALDPMGYLTMPEVPPCTSAYGTIVTNGTQSFSPGVYCGGFDFSGPGTVVTFNPGIYWIEGGGLTVRANATIQGNGVTFILTNAPAEYGGAANYGVVNFASGSTEILSAMTTGTFAGVLIYQDPNAGVTGTVYTNIIHSGAGSVINGTMYFPTQNVEVKANGDLTITGGLVAKTAEVITGSGNLTMNGLGGGTQYSGLKRPTIVQ